VLLHLQQRWQWTELILCILKLIIIIILLLASLAAYQLLLLAKAGCVQRTRRTPHLIPCCSSIYVSFRSCCWAAAATRGAWQLRGRSITPLLANSICGSSSSSR
jgi:hypothetical protein